MRYGHLCGFLEAKLVILGPIEFLFVLPINLIVNVGQNKFKVDIPKNVAKIAKLRPKIGQIPLLSLDINGHNSIIFHPILTFFILNCLFLRDESNGAPFFAPRPHMGKIVRMDPKPTFKKSERVLAFPFDPYLIIKVSKIIGLNPPPPLKRGVVDDYLG